MLSPVLEKYEELFNANLELSKGAVPEPVTDPDQQKKVKDTIKIWLTSPCPSLINFPK